MFAGTFTTAGLDVAIEHGRLVIREEGRIRKLVPEVEQVTFSGRPRRDGKPELLLLSVTLADGKTFNFSPD